jgi:hypothetical protein
MDYKLVIKNIKEKKFEKIYFLHGEEPFYIDEITDAVIKNALDDSERDFNQTILYGKDTELLNLISELKSYPMMAERRLVVLKEAQDFKDLEKLGLWTEEIKEEILYDQGSIQNIVEIPTSLKQVYLTAFEAKQRDIIQQSIDRSRFIDQSQSLNLFMSTPDFNKLAAGLNKKVIFDGRNIYSLESMKNLGFYYESIGRETVHP